MSSILHLRKRLISLPAAVAVPGVTIRPFNGTDAATAAADARAWLALREAAFAGMIAGGRRAEERRWTLDDFRREFTAKSWWRPERMLFAVTTENDREVIIGSVTLGRSGRAPDDVASLMWLMVAPDQRRRGIGKLLLNAIERQAFEAGETTLTLETHATWSDAVRLYRAAGYETLLPRGEGGDVLIDG
jgi:ribosomal protein S18 acetylase RimI-like enzyme